MQNLGRESRNAIMVSGSKRHKSPEEKQHSLQGNTRVQDAFLRKGLDCQVPLVVRLTDGEVVRGTLKEFDQYTLLVLPEPPGPLQLIFKHAIATLVVDAETGSSASQ